MSELQAVLMDRDEMTEDEAAAAIREARAAMMDSLECGDLESAYYTLESEFGLEPDYLLDLIA